MSRLFQAQVLRSYPKSHTLYGDLTVSNHDFTGAVNVLLVTLRHDEILRILREKFKGIRRIQPTSKVQLNSFL